MVEFLRTRKNAIIILLVITLAGFGSKFYAGPGKDWFNNSLAGLFYEIFWCLIVSLFFRKPKPLITAVSVFLCTCVLEFLQLSHLPALEFIRRYFIGRAVIGVCFSWSDFIYYFIGSGIGWFLLQRLRFRKTH